MSENAEAAAEKPLTANVASSMEDINNDQHIANLKSNQLDGVGSDGQHDLLMSIVSDLMNNTLAIDEQTHLFAQVAEIIENDSSTTDANQVEMLGTEISAAEEDAGTCDADDEDDSESNDDASDSDAETSEQLIKPRGLFGVHSGGKSFRILGNNK